MGFLSQGIEREGGQFERYYEKLQRRRIEIRANEPEFFHNATCIGVSFIPKQGLTKANKPYTQEKWTIAMQVSPSEYVEWTVFGAFIRDGQRGANPGALWDLLALATHQRQGADEPTRTIDGGRTFFDRMQGLRFDCALIATGYKANTLGEFITYCDGRVFEAGTGRTAAEALGQQGTGRPDRNGTLAELRQRHAAFMERNGGMIPDGGGLATPPAPAQQYAPPPAQGQFGGAPQPQPASDDLPF